MSLNDLLKAELLTAADYYGADYKATDNKTTLVEALEKDGVTYEQYLADFPPEPEEPVGELVSEDLNTRPARVPRSNVATIVADDVTLIKMTRNNPVYETSNGYRFTREAPFVLVDNDDIDWLIEVEGGFTIAKPSEVAAFYK